MPWSKVCGMWCIYVIHQLNKRLDSQRSHLSRTIWKWRRFLPEWQRDIEVWFSYNYARVILYKNSMRRMPLPDILLKKYMGMIRKYYNPTSQTNPRHREEESQTIYSNKDIRKTIKAKQPARSLPLQYDCKTRRDTKYCTTRQRQTQNT